MSGVDGVSKAVDKLLEEMKVMRMDMRQMVRENQRLRAGDSQREGKGSVSTSLREVAVSATVGSTVVSCWVTRGLEE